MGEDEYDPPIILRRPFLDTIKAIIYIGTGEVHMHFLLKKVTQLKPEEAKWVDYEGEVVSSEDIQLERNCPKETVAPSQMCREKNVIHEEEAPPEPPTTPSSESQDD